MYKNQGLFDLFEPDVAALGYELWGIELSQSRHGSILKIYIDKADGIMIDDCVLVSQQLSALLDVEDPIKGHYELEVSSPGMNRTFFSFGQIKRYIGETIKVHLYKKVNNRTHFIGVLIAINDNKMMISSDREQVILPFNLIEKVKLIPEF